MLIALQVPFGLPSAAERQEVLEHITACMPLSGVSAAELSDRTRHAAFGQVSVVLAICVRWAC